MKRKMTFIWILILSIFSTSCSHDPSYNNINTTQNIGNMSQGGLVTATDEHIFFEADAGKIFRMNLTDKKITFVCDDPTCPHMSDCASQSKYRLQTSENRLFALGDSDVENGSTVVYSSFGEITDGKYHKILEENTKISLPSITKNRILAGIDNKIKLIDMNTKHTLHEYSFSHALALEQLYCIDQTIYFVDGLGNFYKIDISTGKVSQISDEKLRCTIPYGEYIYYIDAVHNSLCRMNQNGTGKVVIAKGCQAYNIFNNTIYIVKRTESGIFTIDLDGRNERKICELEDIMDIYVFEKQQKLVCSSYECCYIGNLDGSGMETPELPQAIE